MRNRQIFDQVSDMEKQIGELYQQLGDLKQKLSELLEENHRLAMENHNLRNHLDTIEEGKQKTSNKEKSAKKKITYQVKDMTI